MNKPSLSCLDLGLVEYTQALTWQEELVQQRCRGAIGDTLLLLEHPPVFTLGRGADVRNILTAQQIPVHRVSRGGEVTFHGPGQLVGYPILDLTRHGRDVHLYLRTLEIVLIEVLAAYGITARQAFGLTGVWVGERKIASLGIGVRRWVTYHGFALNVDLDLLPFNDIVPCGLVGVRMTSMVESLGDAVDMTSVKMCTATRLAQRFGYEETLWQRHSPTQQAARSTQC
jgi:lipoate-protein ligase B